MKTTKLEAMKRHLDFGIESYFEGRDIVPICAVIGAAHIVAHDLVENKEQNTSWAFVGSEVAGLTLRETLSAIRKAPNWLKHANKDSNSLLEITTEDIDFLLFHTILDLGELIGNECVHSYEVSVYQLWFVSKYRHLFAAPEYSSLVGEAKKYFPNLHVLSNEAQLECGLLKLRDARNNV